MKKGVWSTPSLILLSLDVDNASHACTLVWTTPEVEVTGFGEHHVELFAWHHGKRFVAQVCAILNDDVVRWQHVVNEMDRVASVDGDLRGFEDEVAIKTHLNVEGKGGQCQQGDEGGDEEIAEESHDV